jgi:hypothetical protein
MNNGAQLVYTVVQTTIAVSKGTFDDEGLGSLGYESKEWG